MRTTDTASNRNWTAMRATLRVRMSLMYFCFFWCMYILVATKKDDLYIVKMHGLPFIEVEEQGEGEADDCGEIYNPQVVKVSQVEVAPDHGDEQANVGQNNYSIC